MKRLKRAQRHALLLLLFGCVVQGSASDTELSSLDKVKKTVKDTAISLFSRFGCPRRAKGTNRKQVSEIQRSSASEMQVVKDGVLPATELTDIQEGTHLPFNASTLVGAVSSSAGGQQTRSSDTTTHGGSCPAGDQRNGEKSTRSSSSASSDSTVSRLPKRQDSAAEKQDQAKDKKKAKTKPKEAKSKVQVLPRGVSSVTRVLLRLLVPVILFNAANAESLLSPYPAIMMPVVFLVVFIGHDGNVNPNPRELVHGIEYHERLSCSDDAAGVGLCPPQYTRYQCSQPAVTAVEI